MRGNISEISDQLERDANAAATAVKRLAMLAEYCANRTTQQALFPTRDTWETRKDSYLRSRSFYAREHEKLTTLL